MSHIEFINNMLEQALKAGATQADAILFATEATNLTIRLSKLETLERSVSKAFGLRVFVGQKYAIISGNNLASDNITSSIQKVIEMAQATTEDEYSALADPDLFPKQELDLDLYDSTEPSIEWLKEHALSAEAAALAVSGITNSEGASMQYEKSHIAFATSKGFVKEYKTSDCSLSLSVIAGANEAMECDYEYSKKIYLSDLMEPVTLGRAAAERAVKRLNSRSVKTGKMSVILESRIASSLIASFVQAINGATIARGTSFLKDKLGSKIFPENINIIDDPHLIRGLNSRNFDAEGVATKKLALIEKGVLTSFVLDIRSANQLGFKPTGHASRTISSPPFPICSNLYLEPGQQSEKDLIKSVSNGVYITDLFGMGINLITGDYSQGASGFMIENGELTYPVSEITIAGNLLEMFANISVANNLEFKDAINSPTIKIERMMIAGN